jgi:hypothetical protein
MVAYIGEMAASAMRRVADLALVLALGSLAPPAAAQALPDVTVVCAELSEEEWASVEARTRADLAVKGMQLGRLTVSCTHGAASVEFVASGYPSARRSAQLAQDSAERVDQLMTLVDWVTAQAAQSVAEFPTPTTAEPDTADSEPAPAAEDGAASAPVRSAASTAGQPHQSSAPARSPEQSPHVEPGVVGDVELGAGLGGELWATQSLGTLGPRVGVGIQVAPRLRLRVVAGVE